MEHLKKERWGTVTYEKPIPPECFPIYGYKRHIYIKPQAPAEAGRGREPAALTPPKASF